MTKLQIAIDRVPLTEAVALAETFNGVADIVEMGTSLVKDYGNLAIKELRQVLTQSELLVDIKTMDEGAYEFNQGYRYGSDILTVMGAASLDTIAACYKVSQAQHKHMMIDLLEVSDEKISQLKQFEDAIFCLHHSVDRKDKWDAADSVLKFNADFPGITSLAIAGGLDLAQTRKLAEKQLVDIVIVGSHITKAENPLISATRFKEAVS